MLIYIYTDGAARGNPGPSASGFNIYDADHEPLLEESVYNGVKTNNVAEYTAIIMALEAVAKSYGYGNDLRIFSDSELMVRQLQGEYRAKDFELKEYKGEALGLLSKFKSYELKSVPRENPRISKVDKELNQLLDSV